MTHNFRILVVLLVGWLVADGHALFGEPPQKLTSVEGITEYRLENGVQVLLFPDASKPVVTVNMTIFVGSRHEGYGEAGMAHLLEHMLFKGTPTFKNIPKLLQDRGAQFNGTTWLDRTNYYETLPADEDNLEFALRLEADRLVHSYVSGEDLQSEMTVVRNEFESGENSPIEVLEQRIFSTAYRWHNYGNSTIGNQSDIERVPVEKLQAFYRRHYRPDNVMVVVAGKFETAEALELVQKYFGVLDNPRVPSDMTYTQEPPQDGERTTVVRRVGQNQYLGIGYHVPAGGDPEFAAVEILATLLATEPNGRLYKDLVLTKKCSTVLGRTYALHDPGMVFFGAEVPKDGVIKEVQMGMLATLEEIAQKKITEEEVERAKAEFLKSRELRSANSTQLATELSEWAAQGDWRLYFLFRDRIEKVRVEDVQKVAEKYLVRNNRTVGLFLPSETSEKVTVPPRPDVREMLADYQGRKAVSEGEAFVPTPEAISARTQTGKLSTGIRYSFLPKKTRGNMVSISLLLRFGNEESLRGKLAATESLGPLMMRGTRSMDFPELTDALDRLRANVSVSSQPALLSMSIGVKRDKLEELLKIVKEILREPRLDEKEFEVYVQEQITGLQSQITEPDALAPQAVIRRLNTYPADDFRYSPSIQESIDQMASLKIEDVKRVYDEMLGGSNGELVAVGDFEPEVLAKSFEGILEGWKATVPFERSPTRPNTTAAGEFIEVETPDKANSVYYASQQYAMREDDPDYPALVIGNFVLGGGTLSSRLGDRVRQKDGLSYGVFSNAAAHPVDPRTTFMVMAISNPGNRDKLVKAIREELDRLVNEGVTAEELAAAKKGYLQAQQVARSNDQRLVGLLAGDLFANRSMEFHQKFEKQISELTLDQVNAALKKYIVPERLVIATAGDFANVKQE